MELDGMRKNQELRREYFPLEPKNINGIQKISVQNFGIFSILRNIKERVFEFSPYLTGPSLIFGSIFIRKTYP